MAEGTVKTMEKSDLTPYNVMDLVLVKSLSGQEETIRGMYKQTLTGIFEKLSS